MFSRPFIGISLFFIFFLMAETCTTPAHAQLLGGRRADIRAARDEKRLLPPPPAPTPAVRPNPFLPPSAPARAPGVAGAEENSGPRTLRAIRQERLETLRKEAMNRNNPDPDQGRTRLSGTDPRGANPLRSIYERQQETVKRARNPKIPVPPRESEVPNLRSVLLVETSGEPEVKDTRKLSEMSGDEIGALMGD